MSGYKWKVAVIGCGMFAHAQYLPNISKEANAECVAVCDIVFERAKQAAEKYGFPTLIRIFTRCLKNAILILLSTPRPFRLIMRSTWQCSARESILFPRSLLPRRSSL